MTYLLLINADSLMIPLADRSVQMVATSPPYFNQRDYGTAKWEGGDLACDHKVGRFEYPVSKKQASNSGSAGHQAKHICPKCGAKRIDKQLGHEELHDCYGWITGNYCNECYVCHTLAWTREVKRVLMDNGIFWLNLGDSYNGSGGAGGDYNKGGIKDGQPKFNGSRVPGLKAKDLIGIPWHVALALQSDGWWLRNDIIWHKPNPMPEGGARDRFTRAHEDIFMLSKSDRYYFDIDAVREPNETLEIEKRRKNFNGIQDYTQKGDARTAGVGKIRAGRLRSDDFNPKGRNPRDVWMIPTYNYRGAHFATWPPVLVEKMIRAGSKPEDIVLDPFAGSGTTLLVARQLGRNAIGTDLKFSYLHDQARKRLELDKLSAWTAKE